MNSVARWWLVCGSVLMALAVVLGAFAAHGLKGSVDARSLAVFETGVRYQVYHAGGLFVVAWLASQLGTVERPPLLVHRAGLCFLFGIVMFSGSLYLLSTLGWSWLGPVTPLGGLCFIAGWCTLGYAAYKS